MHKLVAWVALLLAVDHFVFDSEVVLRQLKALTR